MDCFGCGNGSAFVHLVLFKCVQVLRGREPSLAYGVCYCQKGMLLWVMVRW